ncbi:MAG: GAF domain-containing protein, partial [Endomicrobiia bacterium]
MKFNLGIFSISAKLRFFIASLILLWIILGILSFLFFNKIMAYKNLSWKIKEIAFYQLQIRQLEKDFLSQDDHDIHFFETGKSKNLIEFEKVFSQNRLLLEDLLFNKEAKNLDLNNKILTISYIYKQYYEIFFSLVALIREKGYFNHGAIGAMRKAIHEVENKLKDTPDMCSIEYHLLMCRRHEKDFLDRKDISYIYKFNESYNKLTYNIVQSQMNGLDKEKLLELCDKYKQTFFKITEIQKRIGLNWEEGLLQNLYSNTSFIVPIIHNMTITVEKKVDEQVKTLYIVFILISLFTIFIFLLINIIITQSIRKAINRQWGYIHKLNKGEFPTIKLSLHYQNEFDIMANELFNYVNNLRKIANFAVAIGKGDFSIKFQPLSKKDELGLALLEMQNSLQNLKKIEEERKQKDEQLNWISTGLAKISDLLRQNYSSMQDFSFAILSNLIKYTDSIAGVMYLVDNSNLYSEDNLIVSSSYGLSYPEGTVIKIGEGLVGTSVKEKKSRYIQNIKYSSQHFDIHSGVGQIYDYQLFICPLIFHDTIYGAIEIASLHTYELYQLEFLEKIAVSIADAISNIQITIRTTRLLAETQHQAELLQQQEEELRQNLEELKSTNEELTLARNKLEIANEQLKVHEMELEQKIIERTYEINYQKEQLHRKAEELEKAYKEITIKNSVLEQQSEEMYVQAEKIQLALDAISLKNKEIEEFNKKITDSIYYALR